jgi:ketosteroid isomerase-like protein
MAAVMQAVNDPAVVVAVAAYFDAVRTRQEARWIDAFADDAVVHDPVGSLPAEGAEGLREVWRVLTGPFKSVDMREQAVFYAGSGAAVHWTAKATGINERTVEFAGITVFEVGPDGKIQTVMSYWDPAAVLIDLAGDEPADPNPLLS